VEETEKIMNAQKARGAAFDTGNIFRRAKALVPVIIPLLISSFNRADELATAMECRCYRGDVGRTRFVRMRLSLRDFVMLFVFVLFGAAIVLGTGVGGGIVLNGKVWMGYTGGAGELSGLLVDFNAMGLPFPQSMSALWANRISAASITKAYAERKGLESADGIMLFDAYEAGDEDAKAVLEEFGFQAAAGIMSLQATLDLQRYAIGGGISARPETTEIIRKAFDDLYDPLAAFLPYGKPEIVTCKFGNEANLIGALAFHLERCS
jgi:hypothetical protein